MSWLTFGILAIALVGSALRVVGSRDLVHSVLWLALTLVSTAVGYVVLHADFLAAVQVLLYTGGVITLMLFGVMLTRRHEGSAVVAHGSSGLAKAGLVAVALLGLVVVAIHTSLPAAIPAPLMLPDTAALGRVFLRGPLVLAFEVLSVLLLAAMVGAITLARRGDPTPTPRRPAPRGPLGGTSHD